MATKICLVCKMEKDISCFCKETKRRDGLYPYCKECTVYKRNISLSRKSGKRYREKNADKISERSVAYREEKQEYISQQKANYYEQNREAVLRRNAAYRNSDRGMAMARARANRRRKRVELATPPWADISKIEQIYEEAVRLQRLDGIPREVDHIIPINSKIVCGLHWHGNLQILTADENNHKRCKILEQHIGSCS